MSTSREVDNETKAGVISRFFEVIENDLQFLTMQLKKATKLEMKVFRDRKVLTHDLLTCPVFCPDHQSPSSADASLHEQQLSFHKRALKIS